MQFKNFSHQQIKKNPRIPWNVKFLKQVRL